MDKKELTKLFNELIERNGITPIGIDFKKVIKGRARYGTRKITIPCAVLERVKEYAIYYVIHELTHFVAVDNFNNYGHTPLFRKIESTILKSYGIIPNYSKAYPKALYNLQGQKLCGRQGVN